MTQLEAVVEANPDIFKLIKNTSSDIVVECIVCEDNINNPKSTTVLAEHVTTFKHQYSLKWNPFYDVNKKEFVRMALHFHRRQDELELRVPLSNEVSTVFLLCKSCSATFTAATLNSVNEHLKTHLIPIQDKENHSDAANSQPSLKKVYPVTEKAKFVDRELKRHSSKGVLGKDSNGDLLCKLCSRIFKPQNYKCYRPTVKKHLASREHTISEAKSNHTYLSESSSESDGDGDGFLSPPHTPPKKPCIKQIDDKTARVALGTLLCNGIPMSQANKHAKPVIVGQFGRPISPTYLRETAVEKTHEVITLVLNVILYFKTNFAYLQPW